MLPSWAPSGNWAAQIQTIAATHRVQASGLCWDSPPCLCFHLINRLSSLSRLKAVSNIYTVVWLELEGLGHLGGNQLIIQVQLAPKHPECAVLWWCATLHISLLPQDTDAGECCKMQPDWASIRFWQCFWRIMGNLPSLLEDSISWDQNDKRLQIWNVWMQVVK